MSSKKNEKILKEQREWERLDEAVVASENFLERNQKQLLIGVLALVLIVGGYLAYKTFYLQPRNEEAQVALFRGEQYFLVQQDSLALYGDGNGYVGFEAIINEYGFTKAGDLAKCYAGISHARMGKYEQAIAYLKDFKGGDKMITHAAKGALGDCLVNTGKLEDGIKSFVDAAKSADDVLLSPIYYKKAAVVEMELKNYDKAIELFTTIKNNYATSPEASDADRYIEEAQLLKTK